MYRLKPYVDGITIDLRFQEIYGFYILIWTVNLIIDSLCDCVKTLKWTRRGGLNSWFFAIENIYLSIIFDVSS